VIEELIGDAYDLDSPAAVQLVTPPLVASPNGATTPFSKGILAVSLQGAGFDPGDAHDVARELEKQLMRGGRREIDRTEPRPVAQTIEWRTAPRAGRYRIHRAALEDPRPIWCCSPAPAVGKTRWPMKSRAGADFARDRHRLDPADRRLMFSWRSARDPCSTYEANRCCARSGGQRFPVVSAASRQEDRRRARALDAPSRRTPAS
jgi:hypothetical protein